jgi:hypothetical protein
MALIDGGGGGPTLNPKAKHYERELFKVFAVETGSISVTQTDWQGARAQLENLASDVRAVRSELEAPADGGKGWTGPAAAAALSALEKLSDTLEAHAVEVGDVDTSLGQVYQAVTDARAAWYSEVASISTYVDPADHMRLPAPYQPTAANVEKYSVPDPDAAAAAEDAKWQERNLAAKKVLEQLDTDTQTAKATMPIDVQDDSESTPYVNRGPASTTRTPGSATQTGSSGYRHGSRGGLVLGPVGSPGLDVPDDTGLVPVGPGPDDGPTTVVVDEGPGFTPDTYDPISSDADVTGTTGFPGSTGPGSWQGSSATAGGGGDGGSGPGTPGVVAGGVGGAAGLAGLLRARGGAMFSSTGSSRAGGSPAARGSAVKGSTGSGKYGVPTVAGKTARVGSVVPAGATQGARAGAGAKAGGRGAAGRSGPVTGRSGSGRGGAAPGAAGGGGARKGDSKDRDEGVDRLTLEDEETWYEGSDESSPQVWD